MSDGPMAPEDTVSSDSSGGGAAPKVKLSAAQRSKIRRLSQPRELAPDEEGGELNIVPFLDIVVNILIFVLATVAVTFTSSIETNPPGAGGQGVRQEQPKKSLGLTIMVVNQGFSIKAQGGNVAPGCTGAGPGIAIQKAGNDYDYAALQACVERLKKADPDFEAETQAFVSGNPDTMYQTVISVIDAIRRTPAGEPLFPDVNFKVGK
ncbi:MAG TPA: biopolymer transporter ExbD [Polyangiaceae bacterium]|jgi:biopolymer transport protein ExbD|nr:biopolymer transporter ExbD [Polyangiaceae bacterium]